MKWLAFLLLCGCADYRQVNAGAQVPVYEGASAADWQRLGFKPSWVGVYEHADTHAAIYLRGYTTRTAWVLVHEYQHHIERELAGHPEALRIARHAFRELCGPGFEIGRNDLLTETP